ncbi:MAG: hypothetical protein ACK44W_03350, partial [Planctomycetota bacterium]
MLPEYADDDVLAKDYDPRLMRRFLGYVRPYAPAVALTFVFLAARIAADLAGPLLFKRAVDGPLLQGDFPGLARSAALFGTAALATGAWATGAWFLLRRHGVLGGDPTATGLAVAACAGHLALGPLLAS